MGPPVGDPTAMYAPPLRYKREALAAHSRLSKTKGRQTRGWTLWSLWTPNKQYNTQWT